MPRLFLNRRGEGFVDYLLLTAVIAGVGFPVLHKYLASPLDRSMQANRGKMVEFIAQNKHSRVPETWFHREPMPPLNDPNNPPPRSDPRPLPDSPLPLTDLPPIRPLPDGNPLPGGPLPSSPLNYPPIASNSSPRNSDPRNNADTARDNTQTDPNRQNPNHTLANADPNFFSNRDPRNPTNVIPPGDSASIQDRKNDRARSGPGQDAESDSALDASDQTWRKRKPSDPSEPNASRKKNEEISRRARANGVGAATDGDSDDGGGGHLNWWLLWKLLIVLLIILLLLWLLFAEMKRRSA